MSILTSAERKVLKARAHSLDPVVIIGAKGLTDEVVAEIDRALKAHELIKVRAPSHERAQRRAMFQEAAAKTGSQVVQEVGKVLVLYRETSPQTDPG